MSKKKKNIPPPKKVQPEIKKTVTGVPQKPQMSASSMAFRARAAEAKTVTFVFGKVNYIIMIGGLVLMALGYILMIGGGSDDPNVFNPAIFNAQRLTVAPLLILLGLAVQIVAIMRKPKVKS